MKYEKCPNCGGKLGVPEKLKGQPVQCPKCDLEFVPAEKLVRSTVSQKKNSQRSANQPKLREIPLPVGVTSDRQEVADSVTQLKRTNSPLMPPKKKRKSKKKVDSSVPGVAIVGSDAVAESATGDSGDSDIAHAETIEQPAVAKIIQQETVEPKLTRDGKLPTLLLADEEKPRLSEDGALKSNPLIVGLLICVSLVSSAGMLFLIESGQPVAGQEVREARKDVVRFYEVREDEELQPYQQELREAQRAYSRGDFSAEASFYQKVMLRFHNEDLTKYSRLAGSPVGDIELEKNVSLLLKDAQKRVNKN